jgi:hypothetical protein
MVNRESPETASSMSAIPTTLESPPPEVEAARFKQQFSEAREAIGRVIVGQQRVVEAVLTAVFCGGNVLLEGVPGLGKTELVKALSRVLDLEFRRIQFTPDLMPADIIGTNIMTSDEGGRYRFEFRRGPIFTQLLLADEINRASPKTQSALLETMQEGSGNLLSAGAALLRAGDPEPDRTGRHISPSGSPVGSVHVQGRSPISQPCRTERGGQPNDSAEARRFASIADWGPDSGIEVHSREGRGGGPDAGLRLSIGAGHSPHE